MKKTLFAEAAVKFFLGLIVVGALVFIPAWTLLFWQGWLFLGVLFVPMLAAGLVLLAKRPEQLRRRLDAKESEDEQKTVLLLGGLMFAAAFVLAGLNFRFGWITLPAWVSFAAAAVFLAAYALYAEVLRENVWLSRTVEVQENQKVVDTGLYGLVRHPMYLSTLLLFLSMPLVLGSLPSFAVMLAYIPVIGMRIRNEEKVLSGELAGYAEYRTRVRYKIIPFIW